jgi:signal transduction histidine kinase
MTPEKRDYVANTSSHVENIITQNFLEELHKPVEQELIATLSAPWENLMEKMQSMYITVKEEGYTDHLASQMKAEYRTFLKHFDQIQNRCYQRAEKEDNFLLKNLLMMQSHRIRGQVAVALSFFQIQYEVAKNCMSIVGEEELYLAHIPGKERKGDFETINPLSGITIEELCTLTVEKQSTYSMGSFIEDILNETRRTGYGDRLVTFTKPERRVPYVHYPKLTREVLIELYRNAYHATTPEESIVFSLTENQEHIVIRIEDEGKGIPKEHADHIFSKGFTTRKEGTGQGLYMIKSYIEETLNGKISLLDKEKGTCFEIQLPKQEKSLQK